MSRLNVANAATKHEMQPLWSNQVGDWATCLSWSNDSLICAVGAASGEVKLFDGRTGTTLATLDAHSGGVLDCAFSPNKRVLATAGQDLTTTPAGKTWLASVSGSSGHSGTLVLQPLRALSLDKVVDADAAGLADAWAAIEENAGSVVNWFPDDVPVLLAQLDGGEGKTSDAGLKLEQDRLLVRIVGQGGRP